RWSFHPALLGPTGAHWLDDPPDLSCKDSTGHHAVDDCPLSCKQRIRARAFASPKPALQGSISQTSSKNSGWIATSSTCRTVVLTPSSYFLSNSHSPSPSIRSIGGAPSRVASRLASPVKLPVVMTKP